MDEPQWKYRPEPPSGTWILEFRDYERGRQFITIWHGDTVPIVHGTIPLAQVIEDAGDMQRWFGPIPQDPQEVQQ